jgi:hypothetical protein
MASKRILLLDPNNPDDQALVADWQDGQEYDIACHVTQSAPFRFDIVSAVETHAPAEAETPEELATPTEEANKTPIAAAKSKTGNPAVDGLMQ